MNKSDLNEKQINQEQIKPLNAAVLMIGTDRTIFKEGSAARQRMIEYGSLVNRLDIIVFSRRSHTLAGQKLATEQISPNVFLWPTNSWSRFLYSRDAKAIARKKLVENGRFLPDLITTQDPFETGLTGLKIAARFNKPLQAQIHTDFLDPHFAARSFLNKVRITMARDVLARADGVRAVSEKIKASLPTLFPDASLALQSKTDVLPIFVDLRKIHDAKPASGSDDAPRRNLHEKYPDFKKIILMASRFSPEKNIPLALEAFADVLTTHPQVALVIVGEAKGNTSEKGRIMKTIATLGLQKNVFLEPWNNDLVSYYKSADLFLVTSEYEGYGMTLVEALAAGCPLVTTDVGVASEILGPFASLAAEAICPTGDKKEIAEKISHSLGSADSAQKFRLASDAFVARAPSHEDYLKKYQELWEKLL